MVWGGEQGWEDSAAVGGPATTGTIRAVGQEAATWLLRMPPLCPEAHPAVRLHLRCTLRAIGWEAWVSPLPSCVRNRLEKEQTINTVRSATRYTSPVQGCYMYHPGRIAHACPWEGHGDACM